MFFIFLAHPHFHVYGLITVVNAYSLRSVGNGGSDARVNADCSNCGSMALASAYFGSFVVSAGVCWLDLWLRSKEKKWMPLKVVKEIEWLVNEGFSM